MCFFPGIIGAYQQASALGARAQDYQRVAEYNFNQARQHIITQREFLEAVNAGDEAGIEAGVAQHYNEVRLEGARLRSETAGSNTTTGFKYASMRAEQGYKEAQANKERQLNDLRTRYIQSRYQINTQEQQNIDNYFSMMMQRDRLIEEGRNVLSPMNLALAAFSDVNSLSGIVSVATSYYGRQTTPQQGTTRPFTIEDTTYWQDSSGNWQRSVTNPNPTHNVIGGKREIIYE